MKVMTTICTGQYELNIPLYHSKGHFGWFSSARAYRSSAARVRYTTVACDNIRAPEAALLPLLSLISPLLPSESSKTNHDSNTQGSKNDIILRQDVLA